MSEQFKFYKESWTEGNTILVGLYLRYHITKSVFFVAYLKIKSDKDSRAEMSLYCEPFSLWAPKAACPQWPRASHIWKQSIPFFWDRQTARECRCFSNRFVPQTALQTTLKQRRRHCHINECASSTLDKSNKIATSCARYNLLLQESSSPEAVVSQRHQGRNSIGKYVS